MKTLDEAPALAVMTCHFNPGGFVTPRRNLLRFIRQLEAEGIPVFIAELAYDNEPWFLAESPRVLRLRTDSGNTMWHKENLLNLLEKIVPPEFGALAWIDGDVWFQRLDWHAATEEALRRFGVVQLFDNAAMTKADGRVSSITPSAASAGRFIPGKNHPGLAWAARRSLWKSAGGLFERAIIGGADTLQASVWLPTENTPYEWLRYSGVPTSLDYLKQWGGAEGGCGAVEGTVFHEWHGSTAGRKYVERHAMMKRVDIDADVVQRPDGLLEFTSCVLKELRTDIRNYFKSRDEDGVSQLTSK